jgi:hypothetical protein
MQPPGEFSLEFPRGGIDMRIDNAQPAAAVYQSPERK